MAGAWKHSRARPFVHIMQDKDIEENYHAQFMEQALHQAGFETRILRGLDELGWDAAGQLIDGEGRLVNCVWKTWAWKPRLIRFVKLATVSLLRCNPYRSSAKRSASYRRIAAPGSAGL